jgi:hypothetical protein
MHETSSYLTGSQELARVIRCAPGAVNIAKSVFAANRMEKAKALLAF